MGVRVPLMLLLLSVALTCDCVDGTYTTRSFAGFKGVYVPIPTPYRDGTRELNLDLIPPMMKFYANSGVSGVIVAGRNGEGFLLSAEECKALYKAVVEAARPCGLRVFAETGPFTDVGRDLAEYAASVGVDVVETESPAVYRPTSADQVLAGLRKIAAAVRRTPVLFFVDPITAPDCVDFVEVFRRAREIPNFAGFACDLELAVRIRAAGLYDPNQQSFIIYNPDSLAAANCLGFSSVGPNLSSVLPGWVADLEASSCDRALRIQQKLDQIVKIIDDPWLDCTSLLKAAFNIVTGLPVGDTRIEEVSCEVKRRLTNNLRRNGVDLECPVRSCDSSSSSEEDD